MKLPILAALALSACTTAPIRDCDTHVRGMWLDEACNPRDGAARPTHVTPEPPKEPPHVEPEPPHVTPTDDKEPDRATDPEGHKAWKERHGVKP